jgi:capsular exopolysaccharide synthesis family protein
MITAKADLVDAERRLQVETDKSANNIRKEIDLAAAQESRFRDMISQQQTEMRKVSGKGFKLKQLEREVEANRRLYETFLARFKEADIADEYKVSNARIIDHAIVPITPFKPNRKRMVMIAVVMGLGLGVLVAFLRDHLDNTFTTKEDVENFLKLPVIGMLPKIHSRPLGRSESERLVLSEPRSPFAEAINDIRTAILFSRIDTPPKVVLITSPLPGEGKTTLALNLALAFSRRGRTLLIDADLRKGRLEELLHLNDHPGLTDMLSGQCAADEAIVADPEAENLFLLTAGTSPPNPLEVISSQRFSDELDKLRNSFEHIVIDGTPLLPVSDSIVLARIVDVAVITIKSDATARDVAHEALKRMEASRVRPVGVVLQQVDMRKLRSYGHRYAASYSGYYGYHKSRKA